VPRIYENDTVNRSLTGRLETLNGGIFTGILAAILERKIEIRKCRPGFFKPWCEKLMYK
jgi:hypothetical protein